MILATRYVIAVPDLAASAAFYGGSLGFEILEGADPGWLFFRRGACLIMAGECPSAIPPSALGDHSYFAYLEMERLEAYYDQLLNAGVEMVKSLRDEPWGMREFGIRTSDGHRIMFGWRQTGEQHLLPRAAPALI